MPNPEMDYRPASQEGQAEMTALPLEKQIELVNPLVERDSFWATVRTMDVWASVAPRMRGNSCKTRFHAYAIDEGWLWTHIERQNLTIRVQLRRFTQQMNLLLKNSAERESGPISAFRLVQFCRIHSSLRVAPVMAAGLQAEVWESAPL